MLSGFDNMGLRSTSGYDILGKSEKGNKHHIRKQSAKKV